MAAEPRPLQRVLVCAGVLLLAVAGLRACGFREGDATVRVRVGDDEVGLERDAHRVARAAQDACDGRSGTLGDLLGIGGPTRVTVVARSPVGHRDRYVIACDNGHLVKIR